jgi:hypothetical protein
LHESKSPNQAISESRFAPKSSFVTSIIYLFYDKEKYIIYHLKALTDKSHSIGISWFENPYVGSKNSDAVDNKEDFCAIVIKAKFNIRTEQYCHSHA